MTTRKYPYDKAFAHRLNVGYLRLVRSGVVFARKQLNSWLAAMEEHSGLEAFYLQNEQILRMNLEAAEERVVWAEEEVMEGEGC